MAASRPLNFLVTGAARGIGRGLTRSLLSRGHRVYLLDSDSAELNQTLLSASAWSPVPETFRGSVVDLRDRSAIRAALADISDFCHGSLDVLINNAMALPHTWSAGSVLEDENDAIMTEWDDKLAVGLTAPFLLSRLCVPLFRAAKTTHPSSGLIINMSSTRATQAEMDHEAYSAVKAGVLGLTQSMAVSLGHRHGIRVNAIIPGWIHVDNENSHSQDRPWEHGLSEQDASFHPAGRVGKVEDVDKAVTFLVDSDFITGQEIVLDGGVTRKMIYPD